MFTYKARIHLHDTDAFGVIFFANQFKIVHDAYEALLEKFGFGFPVLLKGGRYFLPIVHAESDYKTALTVGNLLHITIKVGHIGRTSFAFEYVIRRGKAIVGTAKTVHVTIHPKTGKKTPLPASLRRALEKYSRPFGHG
ncbi:MAG TPA: thioesterase family protein [Candidatus Omnitrophota bacterium]|nr:thioesterase family protein [Candidatus Omnitrophota bacterium]